MQIINNSGIKFVDRWVEEEVSECDEGRRSAGDKYDACIYRRGFS